MRKILNFLLSRVVIIGLLVIAQLAFILLLVWQLSTYAFEINTFLVVLSIIIVIYIINKKGNPSFSIAWITVILVMPVFGGILYLLFGNKKVPKALQRSAIQFDEENKPILKQDESLMDRIYEKDKNIYKQFNYVVDNAYYPVFRNTETKYFATGEDKFDALITELRKAKKYIFMEYFIIREGVMWDTILDILVEKVKEGVEVRVMYDDAGCVSTLPPDYDKKLRSLGIQCKVFNPLRAQLVVQMNNRDHRKICVIDGLVGFSGGINLGDEYINVIDRFGHWKDAAVQLKGEAVWSLTVMFLQFWNFNLKVKDDISVYRAEGDRKFKSDGFVQPFSDSPTDDEPVGETMHMNMINLAKDYVYIMTPYLVPSYEMIRALTISAKNGVDIRIILPHIPDKWYVHMVTKSNYEELIKNGVRIYEYTPGFIHSKMFVSDEELAICGSTNMDYRSYYLHYESGVLFYQSKSVMEMKYDFEKTLKECKEVTLQECRDTPIFTRILQAILSLFSPLL